VSILNRQLIPQEVQQRFTDLLRPLLKLFQAWGLTPNFFTLAGIIITSIAALFCLLGYLRWGGVFILLGGLCDTIDGSLARSTGRTSPFGALLDSTIDRYAELIMYFGLAAHFLLKLDYGTSIAVFLALCGSLMVSYTRARAETLGFESKTGVLQRPERIVFIGSGAMIHPVALVIAICLVAVFANLTAFQRLRHAYHQQMSRGASLDVADPPG
jgi:CDP-diacylglycerol--glycerol-3-phosphate 3-phosphatidyltransferase